MATYDPKKVAINLDSRIQTGLSETFISIAQNADNVTPKVGIMGDVAVALNADKTGVVTINYLHTSSSLPYIMKLADKNKAFPLVIKDANTDGGFLVNCNDCYIQKKPDYARGKEIGEVAVAILVPSIVEK